MPLIRGIARTAVVAGTATAVSNRVSRRQASRWAAQEEPSPAYMAAQPPPAAEPTYTYAAPAQQPPAPDPIEQLRQLGELHQQGVLTDEEFTAEKAKVLGR